jgi:hypothetical protein
MLDAALGFVPVVGSATDTYECLSGRNLLAGTPLSNVARDFALFSAVTLGFTDEFFALPVVSSVWLQVSQK